ncbi:MAG: hypothetical protein ACFE9L_11750, partial [Candidatus Hodarchaeota archaeon]
TSKRKFQIGLMSDTDGSRRYLEQYIKTYKDVDVLIPHVGTIEKFKDPNGEKHLYLSGLSDILTNIPKPQIVIIGEFGLEMGALSSIIRGVTPYITARYNEIFRKTLATLKEENPLEIGATFVTASKNYFQDFSIFRFVKFMVVLVETIEGTWWESRKTHWAKNHPKYINFKLPPLDHLKMLDTTDYYTIRRAWARFNYCDPEIRLLMTKINKIALNLALSEFGREFINDFHKIKWKKHLTNLRISPIRFHYLRSIVSIVPDLFIKKDLTDKDERAKAIIDQLFSSLISFIITVQEMNLVIKNNESISNLDFRSELTKYFSRELNRSNQKILPGEYGTTLRFLENEIEILAECSSSICHRKDFFSFDMIKEFSYDHKGDKIKIFGKMCSKCRSDEEKYGKYEPNNYEPDEGELEQHYYYLEQQEKEQARMWEHGEYGPLLDGKPKKYREFLQSTPQDLEDLLQSHLYLIDESSFSTFALERMKTNSLICNRCKGISFRININNQYIHFICSNEECKQKISINLNKQLILSKQVSEEYYCELCQNRHFNISIGFEYIKQGANHPNINDYEKIHLAYYCLQCTTNEILCCHLDEDNLKFIINAILNSELKNLKDLNLYIGGSRNSKVYNLLKGFGDKNFKEKIIKMGDSLDYGEISFVLGILQEEILGNQKTLEFLFKLLFSKNNLVQAFIIDKLIELEGFNKVENRLLRILNPSEDPFVQNVVNYYRAKKSDSHWFQMKPIKVYNYSIKQ